MSSFLEVSTLEVPAEPERRPRVSQLRLTIALHPDLRRVGDRVDLGDTRADGRISLSRLKPDFHTPDGRPTGPLSDPHISRTPLEILSRRDGVQISRAGSRTALRIGGARGHVEAVDIDASALDRGISVTLSERVVVLLQRTPIVDPTPPKFGLVGESAAILKVRQRIAEVAGLPIPVLIRGESGTGKELVARAIHAGSPRAARPYLSLNMAALPEQVAVAELFGHARGSFTGAVQARDGYFRQASGGTIFLDEVGEASLEIQATLLRVLETGEVQPLGGGATRRVDVRVLAATDAQLEPMIGECSFRSALYHRLAAYELTIPPLRERPEDIPRLFVHFLEMELAQARRGELFERIAADAGETLPVVLMERLLAHAWPGNVREVNNTARRVAATLCARGDMREVIEGLGNAVTEGIEPRPSTAPSVPEPTAQERSASFSDAALIAALEAHRWKIAATARDLGISRSTLYSRIRRCKELQLARDLTRETLVSLRARHSGDLAKMAAESRVSVRALQLRMQALGLS